MSKLDPQLETRLAQAGAGEAVRVIVTLVPSANAASFTPAGVDVTRRFVSINAIAGEVALTQLPALATAPEVLRVEEDGVMRTLTLP
jgi:hypothetical protein